MPREPKKYPTVPITAEELGALSDELQAYYHVTCVDVRIEPVSPRVSQVVFRFTACGRQNLLCQEVIELERRVPVHKLYYMNQTLYDLLWAALDEILKYVQMEEDLPF